MAKLVKTTFGSGGGGLCVEDLDGNRLSEIIQDLLAFKALRIAGTGAGTLTRDNVEAAHIVNVEVPLPDTPITATASTTDAATHVNWETRAIPFRNGIYLLARNAGEILDHLQIDGDTERATVSAFSGYTTYRTGNGQDTEIPTLHRDVSTGGGGAAALAFANGVAQMTTIRDNLVTVAAAVDLLQKACLNETTDYAGKIGGTVRPNFAIVNFTLTEAANHAVVDGDAVSKSEADSYMAAVASNIVFLQSRLNTLTESSPHTHEPKFLAGC